MSGVVRRLVLAGAGAVTVAALASGTFAGPVGAAPASTAGQPAERVAPGFQATCGAPAPGHARCLSQFRHSAGRHGAALPPGYGPADLRSAYELPASTSRKTVAIVDAFGYPTAEADLAVYRRTFGLRPCTVASSCLRVVNQGGAAGPLPAADPAWALETALDLQLASAACPTCRLLLVEADDNSFEALAAATDTAVRLGGSVVSNSYGADESNGLQPFEASYDHPGVPILASSGDFGFTAAQFPAVLPSVIAVGGTTLQRAANRRGWTEQAWSGAGSGCSAWYDKPAWQHDPNCAMRTTADISAVADPQTGVAVYDTFENDPSQVWLILGGTSASSPFLAGVIASTGHPERVSGRSIYARPASAFHDVVGGSNGFCGEDYLCTGVPGYDAPTGRGTPRGLAAFR